MLEEVKSSLRIKSNALDEDLKRDIQAALLDMGRVGIDVSGIDPENKITYDALILSCVIFHAKWINNFLDRGEEWRKAYTTLRNSMARCGDYN